MWVVIVVHGMGVVDLLEQVCCFVGDVVNLYYDRWMCDGFLY